jgi:hypothetical protein
MAASSSLAYADVAGAEITVGRKRSRIRLWFAPDLIIVSGFNSCGRQS